MGCKALIRWMLAPSCTPETKTEVRKWLTKPRRPTPPASPPRVQSSSSPGTIFSPCNVPTGCRTEPGKGWERVSEASSSLEEQQKPKGPSASSCLHKSEDWVCAEREREKMILPGFVSPHSLFSSLFPPPSFPSHALSALEHSVLYWGIKRQHLKLFSEALKGHENTHIASER